MSDGPGEPSVGSVGEEAAKLVEALQEWAKESGSEYADVTAAAAAGAATTFKQVSEHIATGSEDCRYCPLCRVISVVRSTSPEVRAHLSSAASSLMQAAAGVLATPVPDEARARRGSPVEKIDLTDSETDSGTGTGDEWDED